MLQCGPGGINVTSEDVRIKCISPPTLRAQSQKKDNEQKNNSMAMKGMSRRGGLKAGLGPLGGQGSEREQGQVLCHSVSLSKRSAFTNGVYRSSECQSMASIDNGLGFSFACSLSVSFGPVLRFNSLCWLSIPLVLFEHLLEW